MQKHIKGKHFCRYRDRLNKLKRSFNGSLTYLSENWPDEREIIKHQLTEAICILNKSE